MRLALAVALVMGCGSSTPPVGGGGAVPAKLAPGRHTAPVDGVELSYEVRGTGPVCVGFPGGPGFDAGYLRSEGLERHFTMVYVDPLGTGASGKLPRYSMTRDVASVEQLRVALGIDKLCLLGHSYGGFIALRYATEHPDHVGALILYSTSPATHDAWVAQMVRNIETRKNEPWFAEGAATFPKLSAVTTQAELDANLAKIIPFYFVDWTRDQAKLAPLMAPHKLAFDVMTKRDEETYDVREKLAAITAPTLIVTGDQDFILGVVPSRWAQAGIQGAKLEVIGNAGHFAHIEVPKLFEQSIAEFAASLRPDLQAH